MMKKIINFLLILTISFSTLSCGGLKKVDQRSRPTDPEERRRQAVNEGRGTGINDLFLGVKEPTLILVRLILCGEHR